MHAMRVIAWVKMAFSLPRPKINTIIFALPATAAIEMDIIVADDHAILRTAVRRMVLMAAPTATLRETADYTELFTELHRRPPDFLLLDLIMPGIDDWKATVPALVRGLAETRTVVVSATDDPDVVRSLVPAGIVGFIPKRCDERTFLNALRLIFEGGTYLPTGVVCPPMATPSPSAAAPARPLHLTPRQRTVLSLVSTGLSNKEIARRLNLSEATVKVHLNAAVRMLGVRNRTEAALVAKQLGLAAPLS